jgi:hypothetical protein
MANKMGESDTQIEIKISCLSLIVTMMLMIMN